MEAPIEDMFVDAPPRKSEWVNGVLDLKGRAYDSDIDHPNRGSYYDPYEHYGHHDGHHSDALSYDND